MSSAAHHDDHAGAAEADRPVAEPTPLVVLVYSDDPATREQVRFAVGRRPRRDLPSVEYVDLDSSEAVIAELDTHTVDLAVLDGEATPVGGLGICRQAKNEIYPCPPILVITGRRDDRWLATWSLADAVVSHPIDPFELAETVADLLESIERRRIASR